MSSVMSARWLTPRQRGWSVDVVICPAYGPRPTPPRVGGWLPGPIGPTGGGGSRRVPPEPGLGVDHGAGDGEGVLTHQPGHQRGDLVGCGPPAPREGPGQLAGQLGG